MTRTDGPVAIVTGAASGIGRATALALVANGARVMLADLDADGLDRIVADARAAGGDVAALRVDATREEDHAALVATAVDHFGRPDWAANNVGAGTTGVGVCDEAREDWDRTLALSLTSTWLGMQHQIPAMIAGGGGAIVNTASMAGLRVSPTASPSYSAAKAGVLHLTRYAAHAHASDGIRVNSVSPGLTATAIVQRMFSPEQQAATAARGQLIARAVQPSEVAEAIIFLFSNRAAMMTGTNLEVCGGAR
jgi:short-subunit dehydrogenase